MKQLYFDSEDDFLQWNEEQGNFVTAVYDGGDFVCDVLAIDVLYLQDVGFLDEACNIIPPLNIEQTEMFKDSWGVCITVQEELFNQ